MEEKKNTGLIIVIVILLIAVLGLAGYLVYDIVINQTNEPNVEENNDVNNNIDNNKIRDVSINDNLVTSLAYPRDVFISIEYTANVSWNYKEITINELTREKMMHNAAYGLVPIEEDYKVTRSYSATDIERNFKKIFGPDTKYTNGDIATNECGQIGEYDEEKNVYIAETGCGGDSIGRIDRISKTYKAEQDDNNIYVYQYVQSVLNTIKDENNYDSGMITYLLDRNDNKTTTIIEYENYKNEIYKMMDEGKVDTYKWTFKKQSDGNYYFYSGAWEN